MSPLDRLELEVRTALNRAIDLDERADVYERDADTAMAAQIARAHAATWKARAAWQRAEAARLSQESP